MFRVEAKFADWFHAPFEIAYQGLAVSSQIRKSGTRSYSMDGYYTSFLHTASSLDTGLFRWHFGIASLMTFSVRSGFDEKSGTVVSERAIDTRLSQAYPTGGFTLFPKAPIRISMIFLPGNANLLYGWLRLTAEFETERHIFFPSVELLNHQSFGKGLPSFVQPPGAFVMGYGIKFEPVRFLTRLGFVLNSTQGFNSARVNFSDRLIFEFAVGYTFSL